jgi:hypothetical protein
VRIVFAVRRQSGGLGKNLSCANCRLHIVIIPTSHAIPATQAHEEKQSSRMTSCYELNPLCHNYWLANVFS